MMSSAVIGLAGRMASLHAAGGAGAQSFPSATLFAAIGFALLLTLGGYILWRRRRTPAELRGNWWPRFEREFHAYTQHAADIASDTVRRRQQRPPFG